MKFLAYGSLIILSALLTDTQTKSLFNNEFPFTLNNKDQSTSLENFGSKGQTKNQSQDQGLNGKLENINFGNERNTNFNYINTNTNTNTNSNLCKKLIQLKSIQRDFEGLGNNIKNPKWGSAMTNFKRLCAPTYQDNISKTWNNHPKARTVSNLVGSITGPFQNSKVGANILFVQFGQFVDHDVGVVVGGSQVQNIQIPMCDKFLDKKCKGKQKLLFTRSDFDKDTKQRTQINSVSHWIDGSQMYGVDKQIADSLRTSQKGKLYLQQDNLLPRDTIGFYTAADDQVNQNPSLIIFQTIFRRQHNRICDLILSNDPTLKDQQVYQAARNYVIGLYQHLVYDQFLPTLFGKDRYDKFVGPYKYDQKIDPSLYTQFTTATYRYGHSIVNAPFRLIDTNGRVTRQLKAGQIFFNPGLVTKSTFQPFLNGFIKSYAKEKTLQIVQDLRSFLFNFPGMSVKMDLFASNIQRGRDHGICWLNDARQKLGLERKSKFNELFDEKKAQTMEQLYQKTDKVDLWLGIIGQRPVQGAVLGELGIRVNALQFKNLRNGDRLWYQNIFPQQIIRQIKSTTFADLIERNTGVRLSNRNAFKIQ